jgi:hypothetical protein
LKTNADRGTIGELKNSTFGLFMRKFLGYILTPFGLAAFFLLLIIFQPLQWVAYKYFGYSGHKKVVDLLNLGLFRTFNILGNRIIFINKQNLPLNRPMIFTAPYGYTRAYLLPAKVPCKIYFEGGTDQKYPLHFI